LIPKASEQFRHQGKQTDPGSRLMVPGAAVEQPQPEQFFRASQVANLKPFAWPWRVERLRSGIKLVYLLAPRKGKITAYFIPAQPQNNGN